MVLKGILIDEDKVTDMFKTVPTIRASALEQLLWVVKGPFGFIPTRSGLSSSMKLTNSLTSVSMDSLLSSIDDALHKLKYEAYTLSVNKFHDSLVRLERLREDEN